MSRLFLYGIGKATKPGQKFVNASDSFVGRAKPVVLALAALGATYGLTTAYVYEIGFTEGASMSPTIPDRFSMLGVNKTYRKGRGIQVGDIVSIVSPQQPNQYAGKRVIALPGDYVLRSKVNSPTPGGVPLAGITDWKKRLGVEQDGDEVEDEWEEPEMIQVPEGHVWLEGDNQAWSRDSRTFGPVPMALIRGRSSWFSDGFFSYTSLNPGKGLHKVEDWEKSLVLGESNLKEKR